MSRAAQLVPYLIQHSTPSSVATLDCVIPNTTSTPAGPGYRYIQIVGWLLPATDGAELQLRLSNDGGSTFRAGASDYAWVQNYHSFTGADTSGSNRDDADSEISLSAAGNAAGEGMSFNLMLNAPLHASRFTVMTGQMVDRNTSGQWFRSIVTGANIVAAEINNAVRLLFSSGNIASGEVDYFGLY